jgi:hypothetical protein
LLHLQIGFIGRLDYQKGIDLIKLIIPDLMLGDVQFVRPFFLSFLNVKYSRRDSYCSNFIGNKKYCTKQPSTNMYQV